jgi:hypothetical protein
MSIMNKALLAAALTVSSTSLTLAQGFDPNLGNRIPALNEPGVYGYPPGGMSGPRLLLPAAPFESAMVGLSTRPDGAIRSAPVARRHVARTNRHRYDGAFRTAPVGLNIPPPSVVGPDNYRYWRQACCF